MLASNTIVGKDVIKGYQPTTDMLLDYLFSLLKIKENMIEDLKPTTGRALKMYEDKINAEIFVVKDLLRKFA